MPLIHFEQLEVDERLQRLTQHLVSLPAGMVLSTGHAASGKLTLLLALLTHTVARGPATVSLLSDESEMFEVFRPLPGTWTVTTVEPSVSGWRRALQSVPPRAIPVIAPLTRLNAATVFTLAAPRWVFATLETGFLGTDVSHPLREMGVSYDQFVRVVRCVWSQFLVDTLCPSCGVAAHLSKAELQSLPLDLQTISVRRGNGCKRCNGKGTAGRAAVVDVTLLPVERRDAILASIQTGVDAPYAPKLHASATDTIDALLGNGAIGFDTYRTAIARNPTLRAKRAMESERESSAHVVTSLSSDIGILTALADRGAAGVLVADASGRVRFSNARAREALGQGASVRLDNAMLTGATSSVGRAITDALINATADKPRATRLSVVLANKRPVHLFVAPLPVARDASPHASRSAMLVLGGTRFDDSLPSAQDLRQYFSLTPAESTVAHLLCAGFVPKDVARQLQVSIPTVRSHLRSLLSKTGTRRQTELIGLLSSLPATRAGLDAEC